MSTTNARKRIQTASAGVIEASERILLGALLLKRQARTMEKAGRAMKRQPRDKDQTVIVRGKTLQDRKRAAAKQ